MRAFIPWIVLAAVLFAATSVTAADPPTIFYGNPAHSTRHGDYTLHHLAMPSQSLPPDIARRYGITRSANRALLNLSLRRGSAADSVALAAPIRVMARSALGQQQALNLREVREGEALYYLAEARIEPRDTITFELVVELPQGAVLRTSFSQEFWPVSTSP